MSNCRRRYSRNLFRCGYESQNSRVKEQEVMSLLHLSPEELLTTTRSVRRRLDFSRPVEPEVIRECLEIALQAPTGSYSQGWHFVVVTDTQQRQLLAEVYRKGWALYRKRRVAGEEALAGPELTTEGM